MKLAVRKEPGTVPGGGFHYMLHLMAMESDAQAAVFEMIGYQITEVGDDEGARLLRDAGKALFHQVEVAWLVENQKAQAKV
jgi:hypothetical protein